MKLVIVMLVACALTASCAVVDAQVATQRNEKSNNAAELPYQGAPIEEVVVESSLYIKPKARTNVRRVRSVLTDRITAAFAEHKRVKRRGHHHRGQGGEGFFNSEGHQSGGFNPGAAPSSNVESQIGAGLAGGPSVQFGTNTGVGPNGATAGANANLGALGGQNGQAQGQSNSAANSNYNNGFDFDNQAAIAQAQGFESQGNAGGFGASSANTITQNTHGNPFGVQNSAGASLSQVYKLPNGQTINFASTNSFANGPFGNNANSRGGAVSISR